MHLFILRLHFPSFSLWVFYKLRNTTFISLILLGCSDELGDLVSFGLEFSDDLSEREILFGLLRCIISISHQLGKSASAIFYESLVGTPTISAEELVPCLLKILETGYSSSVVALNMSDLGADVGREKELANHKNLRKFSIDMLLSLHALGKKAVSWDRMLNVLESYLRFLVPRKILQDLDAGAVFNISTSILVQATSQIAKVMFESALDVLLFISYLLSISGQVRFSPFPCNFNLYLAKLNCDLLHFDICLMSVCISTSSMLQPDYFYLFSCWLLFRKTFNDF